MISRKMTLQTLISSEFRLLCSMRQNWCSNRNSIWRTSSHLQYGIHIHRHTYCTDIIHIERKREFFVLLPYFLPTWKLPSLHIPLSLTEWLSVIAFFPFLVAGMQIRIMFPPVCFTLTQTDPHKEIYQLKNKCHVINCLCLMRWTVQERLLDLLAAYKA